MTPQEQLRKAAELWEGSYAHTQLLLRRCGAMNAEPSMQTLCALRKELQEHQGRTGGILRTLGFLPTFNEADMRNHSLAFRGLPPESGRGPATGPAPPFNEADRQAREPGVGVEG